MNPSVENGRHARVLWLTERYPPLPGGMAVSCFRQVTGLRRGELDIDLVLFSTTHINRPPEIQHRDHGTDVTIFETPHPGDAVQMAWKTAQAEHARRPYSAIVGFGAARAGHVAATFGKWLGCPVFISVRGNDFDRDWFDFRRGWMVREALEAAQAIWAVSPDAVQRIRALFPKKIVCWMPNGIDCQTWTLLPEDRRIARELRLELAAEGRKVFGLFGEIKFKKQIAGWLAALREKGLLDRLTLLIVGKTDGETEQILDDPALAPRHKRVKFLPQEELPGYFAACDFITLPSLFEGMPNTLLEGMALGVPALVSDAGAMGEIVFEGINGFVFPAGDMERAAAATERALAVDPEAYRLMCERAKERIARDFSLENELKHIRSHLLPTSG